MAVHLFKKKDFSSVYRRYMHPTSSEVMDLILSYVEEKKGKPYGMALDVGCGTGRYTMALARHFQKVLGVDISESQIQEAKAAIVPNNVSYQISSAENLPLEDASVDLVNAGLAAHWFNLEKFVQEAVRVLKPNGCLAVHAFYPSYTIQYGDVSEALSAIITEVFSTLFKYKDKTTDHMMCYYQEIFKAVPLPDKRWVPDIPVTFSMYLADMMGHIQSIYMYQAFSDVDPEAAEKFLMKSELRFRDILGADSDTAAMKVFCRHYCVLACKS